MVAIPRHKLPKKRYRGFMLRYHGNYVGPGWSAGKYQASVRNSKVPAVDEFDETAKKHDAAYATGKNLKKADYEFYKSNWGKGVKRSLAAAAVGIQGYFRPDDSSSSNATQMAPRSKQTKGRKRRGSKIQQPKHKKQKMAKVRVKVKQSKSSGFVQKPRRRFNILDRMAQSGIVDVIERGGTWPETLDVSTRVNSLVVGHTTCNRVEMFHALARAIAKMVANKLKRSFRVLEDTYLGAGAQQETWIWTNKLGVQSSTNVNNSYTTANNVLWRTVTTNIYNVLTTRAVNEQLTHLLITAGTGATQETVMQLDLTRCMIDVYVKSAMKMQNRTRTESNSLEEDDVDNVPLYGKSYEGSGNYALYTTTGPWLTNAGRAESKIIAESTLQECVMLDVFGPSTSVSNGFNLAEPPSLRQMQHCQKIGKIKFEPGEIKTSVIYYKAKKNLNRTIRNLLGPTNEQYLGIGKYRFFILEKMISSNEPSVNNRPTIGYEVDTKIGCVAYCPSARLSSYFVDIEPQPPV